MMSVLAPQADVCAHTSAGQGQHDCSVNIQYSLHIQQFLHGMPAVKSFFFMCLDKRHIVYINLEYLSASDNKKSTSYLLKIIKGSKICVKLYF